MRDRRLKSIADIAAIAGVSKSTVSRALNDSTLVEESTRKRIKTIAEEHRFRPSATARNLSLRTTRTIAFVTHAYSRDECCVSDPFSLEIMGGIAIGLHELGYDLLVLHVDPDDREWASQYLDTGRVDGFILMTSVKKRAHIDMLLELGAPFVAWGQGAGAFCSVCGDDRVGGRLAAERLLSLGRRRIGFIGGTRIELEVKERYRGFEEGLTAGGSAVDPLLVTWGDYSERSGALAAEELLDREPKLDAIFANSDIMAIAAMRALQARGRKIPDDIAVIGYDGLSLASYVSPALTTISQKIPLAGKLLARDLVAYLEQGIITTTTIPVELVTRQSG
ncbi:MAG TPA: LacI family DNA-binding transcriptional regulator [Spirochaetia bacterium]